MDAAALAGTKNAKTAAEVLNDQPVHLSSSSLHYALRAMGDICLGAFQPLEPSPLTSLTALPLDPTFFICHGTA